MKKFLLLLVLTFLMLIVQHQLFAQGSCPSVRVGSVTLTSLSNNGDGTCNFRLSFCFTNPTNGAKSIRAKIYCGISCVTAPTPTFSFCTDATGQAGVERCTTYDFTCSCSASIQVNFDSQTGSSSCGGSTCNSTGCISFGVLAVKLVEAWVEERNGQNCIRWSVADQSGIAGYEIEGSSNGADFIKLGEQNPASSSSSFNYCTSQLYRFFRLKVKEQNGNSFYSKVLHSAVTAAKNIQLYPNPAGNRVFISNYSEFRNCNYQVCTIDGRIISNGIITGKSLNTTRFPNGSYLLIIKDLSGKKYVQLFVKAA